MRERIAEIICKACGARGEQNNSILGKCKGMDDPNSDCFLVNCPSQILASNVPDWVVIEKCTLRDEGRCAEQDHDKSPCNEFDGYCRQTRPATQTEVNTNKATWIGG